ncbi:MAG: galactose oxidase, central domain protein, partial [Bacteroidetes bacterium]|nr:galactose oxidase, central domain protein [Bacteroidota bacterium]
MSTIYTHILFFKKATLTILSLLLFGFTSFAQWSSIASQTGGVGNDGAVSFTIDGNGYTLAGSSTNKVYMYDTLADTWTVVDTVPVDMGHAFAMSFTVGGRVFIVGGDTSGVPVSTVWEYTPNGRGHFLQKQDFPAGPRDAGFGFGLDGYGYVGAGNDNVSLFGDIWKYDPLHDAWTHLSDSLLPEVLIFPTSFVVGHKAYILTGGTAPTGVNEVMDMWAFDGTTMTQKASYPGAGRQAAFTFSNNGYGYVGGGQANYTTNYNDMWRYDAANDQWSAAPGSPLLGGAWSSTFVVGNNAYAGL